MLEQKSQSGKFAYSRWFIGSLLVCALTITFWLANNWSTESNQSSHSTRSPLDGLNVSTMSLQTLPTPTMPLPTLPRQEHKGLLPDHSSRRQIESYRLPALTPPVRDGESQLPIDRLKKLVESDADNELSSYPGAPKPWPGGLESSTLAGPQQDSTLPRFERLPKVSPNESSPPAEARQTFGDLSRPANQNEDIGQPLKLPNRPGRQLVPPFEHQPTTVDEQTVEADSQHAMRARRDGSLRDNPWLEPYENRALDYPSKGPIEGRQNAAAIVSGIRIDPQFSPWWDSQVRLTSINGTQFPVRLAELMDAAVIHSPYVQALTAEPKIQQFVIVQESAAFDWGAFVESTFQDTNEPIGSDLTTGNDEERFKEHQLDFNGGVRKRNRDGSELELNQRLGRQSNNSTFLNPNPQNTSQFELRYVQPLLNGRGRRYNLSQVHLARISLQATKDEVAEELPNHLVQVAQAYWDLYAARAQLVQRHQLMEEAIQVLERLKGRNQVDVIQRQILRAQATISKQKSDIARAENRVRNSETRLRLLVNDPLLNENRTLSFVPVDAPQNELPVLKLSDSLTTALANRGEISRAIQQIKAAQIRLGVARNDLLPRLDLILSTRLDGIDEDRQLGKSFGNQFSEGRPSYTAGFKFEVPIGNRLSRAQRERREWEMFRIIKEFENTVEQTLAEVEIAVREFETAKLDLLGQYSAMVAAAEEVNYLADRWELLPGVGDSAVELLEDLFEARERLAGLEADFVNAQVSYSMAMIQVYQAMGVLLQMDEIQRSETAAR